MAPKSIELKIGKSFSLTSLATSAQLTVPKGVNVLGSKIIGVEIGRCSAKVTVTSSFDATQTETSLSK